MTQPSLARLLQLASPALPVGAYTYSQGLEWAAESGSVRDEATAEDWLGNLLDSNIGRFEAPMLARFIDAWRPRRSRSRRGTQRRLPGQPRNSGVARRNDADGLFTGAPAARL